MPKLSLHFGGKYDTHYVETRMNVPEVHVSVSLVKWNTITGVPMEKIKILSVQVHDLTCVTVKKERVLWLKLMLHTASDYKGKIKNETTFFQDKQKYV